MTRHEESIVIQRPVAEVFSYMDDVSREHEYQTNLLEASQDPPGPSAVGTRKRYVSEFMGRRIQNTYVVTALESERRVVYETTRDSAVQVTSEIRWEPVDGGTRVTMAIEGKTSGVLRFVPRRVLESVYESELKATLSRLKGILEAGP